MEKPIYTTKYCSVQCPFLKLKPKEDSTIFKQEYCERYDSKLKVDGFTEMWSGRDVWEIERCDGCLKVTQ